MILKFNIGSIFKQKKIFLINYNEMIIEIACKLFFSGFNIVNFENVLLEKIIEI